MGSAADEGVPGGWATAYPDGVETGPGMANGVIGGEAQTMGPDPAGDGTGVMQAGASEKVNACVEVSTAFVSRQASSRRFPWILIWAAVWLAVVTLGAA